MSDILLRAAVRVQTAVSDLRNREEGQTTTEYAILLGFLAIAIIVAILLLRDEIRQLFSDAAASVSGAPGSP
jgi:Flp pilus assembly pilin Flp